MGVSRKEMVMVALFLVLLGLYLVYGSGCFKVVPIRIEESVRPTVLPAPPGSTEKPRVVYVTSIAFDREYELTAVKVYRIEDLEDKSKPPLWHLVGKPKSSPTRSLVYGGTPQGMSAFQAGSSPAPLEANVPYRIIAEAGRLKGEHDFTISAPADAAGR